MFRTATILAGAIALAACQPKTMSGDAPPAAGRTATATLMTAAGKKVGMVTVSETAGGLHIVVKANDLPPGLHGLHLHTVGKCEAPDFASAGPHWNPTGMKHGSKNPMGPHEGDLPNIMIGADGKGMIAADIPGASFAGLLDADGAAMVLHAATDDLMTDPSGNSGARLACGVLVAR